MIKGEAIIIDSETGLYVSYEDYDVECFDGSDYEVIYTLDQTNRRKLWKALKAENMGGTLEEMILEHFGEYLDKDSFSNYCEERNITFELFTWVS